jgi:hypothetical protein
MKAHILLAIITSSFASLVQAVDTPIVQVPDVTIAKTCSGPQQNANKDCVPNKLPIVVYSVPMLYSNACAYTVPATTVYDNKNSKWVFVPEHEEIDRHCQTVRSLQTLNELNEVDPNGKTERNKLALQIMCEDAVVRKSLDKISKNYCKQ